MKRGNRYKHGMTETRFYNIWTLMRARCNRRSNSAFQNYGGRGIKCLWESFEEFKKDMLKSYQGHVESFGEIDTTLNRTDNDGNYCKENCNWSTRVEQGRNKRNNVLIEFNGESRCMSEWEQILGLRRGSVWEHLNRDNWSIRRTLSQP